jgi:GNAT superfamily N-acetyltransferase
MTGLPVLVRPRRGADRRAVEAFLAERNTVQVARLGVLDALDHPALLAEAAPGAGDGGQLLGVLTYVIDRESARCEILTLHVAGQWRGVGSALIGAVERLAAGEGCDRLWLVTTNDNVDALRFYQRRGFRLAALHPGAADDSRARLKPGIPTVGDYGIPLRDELELEKRL